MVADRVEVISRAAGQTVAARWSSDGQGTFTVDDATRDRRGTSVILHLKADSRELLDRNQLRTLVKRYSDFIAHPIYIQMQGAASDAQLDAEVVNSREAIWRKRKDEIDAEAHKAFYRQVARAFDEPARTIHIRAEGMLEYNALLYVPRERPFDLFLADGRSGLQLYVQRVLIDDDCRELLPPYLRFVRGVVESADLPLNVSREMIQQDRALTRIRTNLTRRVLDELCELRDTDHEIYDKVWQAFGAVLKEGIAGGEAGEYRDTLLGLLRFASVATPPGGMISLATYVAAMPADQPAIYVLSGDDRERLERSPYLEGLKARGWDTLLLTDPVDEWLPDAIGTFEGKPLKAVDKGTLPEAGEADAKQLKSYASLLEALGDRLSDQVKAVRLSRRLTDSAAVLVADEHAMSANMERLLARMGRDDVPHQKRILELNGTHPAVDALLALYERDRQDQRIATVGQLLLDQALVAEGSRITNPTDFAQRINSMIQLAIHTDPNAEPAS
jgi:molecular chaperone HtpG